MTDEKVTNLEHIKLPHSVELRELALAAFYPQSHSSTGPVNQKLADRLQALQRWQQRDNPSPPENVAKPWKKPWDK